MQRFGGEGSPLFHLARSGILSTRSGFDRTADVDVVVVAAAGHVVVAAVGFGERRQVEGETCGCS